MSLNSAKRPREETEELRGSWNITLCNGNMRLVRHGEASWRAQLEKILLDAPYRICFIGSGDACCSFWHKVEKGTLVLTCDEEEAQCVGTLPYSARLDTLRLSDNIRIPLSKCTRLTSVCLQSDHLSWNDMTAKAYIMNITGHNTGLRVQTEEFARMLGDLPVLRAVHLGMVWDPSVIVGRCSRSLVSFQCHSCAVFEAPMPHLERFVCGSQFACIRCDADVITALRGCTALRTVYIGSAWALWSLFTVMVALPQLKEATLPLGNCREVPKDHVGTSVTRGMVHHVLVTASARLLLLPTLAYLLRVRVLSRAARVTGVGTAPSHWVVFKAPTTLFIQIWKAIHSINLSENAHCEKDWMY